MGLRNRPQVYIAYFPQVPCVVCVTYVAWSWKPGLNNYANWHYGLHAISSVRVGLNHGDYGGQWTSIFKQIIDVIAPFAVELFNRSVAAGHFPAGSRRRFSPYREEAGARHHRHLFVSTNFESVSAVKVIRTPRCSPAEGLFNDC